MPKPVTKAKSLMKQVNAVMGAGTLKLGSDPAFQTRFVPTSVMPFDVLLRGGLPRNRCTEIYGDYSTLKSFVGLTAIAATQEAGGSAALVDTEHSYDPEWLEELGGDPASLLLKQPETGEQAVEISEVLIRDGIDLLVWDSIAATITQSAAHTRASDDKQPANTARFMSRALPRLTAANHNTAMLWINQTRDKVGIAYGQPEFTPGGRAMGFFATYRIRCVKAGKVTEDVRSWDGEKWVKSKRQTGQKIRCTLEKSKLNRPFREAWMTFDLHACAIDDTGFLISQGLEEGLIEVSGQSWTIPQLWKGGTIRGREAFRDALIPDDIEWLRTTLMEGEA
jgi:recombination protein RecA